MPNFSGIINPYLTAPNVVLLFLHIAFIPLAIYNNPMRKRHDSQYYHIDLSRNFADFAYRLKDNQPVNIGFHYHEGYEIIQLWSDNGYVLAGDKIYPMQKGNIYILNAFESHCTNPDPNTPYIRSKITFSASYAHNFLKQIGLFYLLEPFMNAGKGFDNCIIPDERMLDDLDNLFKRIDIEFSDEKDGYEAFVNVFFLEMLAILYRWYINHQNSPSLHTKEINSHVNAIISYINMHLFEDITLESLSHNLHLSKYYLCHLFKNTVSITIMQYITERRIAEAKKLLALSDKTISEIAAATGFSNFSVFSRTFKKVTGHTPLEYRKRVF